MAPDDDPDDYQPSLKRCLPKPKAKDSHCQSSQPFSDEPLFPCPGNLPMRPKQEDSSRGICPMSQGPDVMALPGVMPSLSSYSSTSGNEFMAPGMMETVGSSGVSTNSDRQQVPSDQTTPSTQQSSVNNSFTPPGEPSPQKQQQEQQQEQNRRPQQRPYDILSADVYPSNPNSQPPASVPPPPSTTAYFTNNSNNNNNSFASTFSAPQERPPDLAGTPNPFAMHASWHYATNGADSVNQGGNMGQTMLGGGPGGGSIGGSTGGVTGIPADPMNEGNWDQILSSMGWNEWQQGSG